MASGSEDSTIKIWDLVAGKNVSTLSEGHKDAVNTLDFHPRDFMLVSGSTDRTTRFWNLDTFKQEESLSPESIPIRIVKFDRRGNNVIVGTDRTLKVWNRDESSTICISRHRGSWGRLMSVYVYEGDEDRGDDSMLVCGVERSFVSVWKTCSSADDEIPVSKLKETVQEEEKREIEEKEEQEETPKYDPHAKTMIHESKLSEDSSKISDVDHDEEEEEEENTTISAYIELERHITESTKPSRSMKEDRLSEIRMKDCHALLSKIRVWWSKSNLTSRKRWLQIYDTIKACHDTSVGLDAVIILFRRMNVRSSVDLSSSPIVFDMMHPLLSDARFAIQIVALHTTKCLVFMFKDVILNTLALDIDSHNKRNINLMERREKCNAFCTALRRLRPEIETIANGKQFSMMRRISTDIVVEMNALFRCCSTSSSRNHYTGDNHAK